MNSPTPFPRRTFLTGLAATFAAGWLHDSDSLTARTLRGAAKELGRELPAPVKPDLSGFSERTIDICWIGHATVLINFFGYRILTDPVLFKRIGLETPFGTLGRKRLQQVPVSAAELQNVDMVLVSHAHMDHLDVRSLRALPKKAAVVTARRTADLIAPLGYKQVRELGWGEQVRLGNDGGTEVEAFEVKHWGARFQTDTFRGYNGYVLTRGGTSLIFGGDTALCEGFEPLKRFRARAAIMPIGSYGRGSTSHCTPEEAVRMLNGTGAEYVIPVHHSTFAIGREPLAEPLERLGGAIARERIALQRVGEIWSMPG